MLKDANISNPDIPSEILLGNLRPDLNGTIFDTCRTGHYVVLPKSGPSGDERGGFRPLIPPLHMAIAPREGA